MILTAMEPKHVVCYLRSKFTRKGFTMLMVKSRRSDLELIGSWLEDNFQIYIDSIFKVKEIEDAATRNRDTSKKGRVVVKVSEGWI